MTKIEKMSRTLNDNFPDKLKEEFKKKFDIEINTSFSIFTMKLHTTRADDHPMTQEQFDWIASFETGYMAAMNQVWEQ